MTSPDAQPSPRKRWLLHAALLIAGLFCLVRGYVFVDRYATNVPYSDQWDLLNPLFNGRSIVGWFTYQHGPHRQGLGGVLTDGVGRLTDFDGRAEAMLCLAGLTLAMLVALALRRRLNGGLSWIDVVWPFVFLSARHGHHLAVVPNNAHSTTPLLLVLTLAYLMTLSRSWWREALLVLLGVITTFTGFGVFVAPLVPLVFLVDALRAWRSDERRAARVAVAFGIVSILANATFLIGYHPDTSNPNFGVAEPSAYLIFLADLFGLTLWGRVSWISRAVGTLLVIAVLLTSVMTAWHVLATVRRRRAQEPPPSAPSRDAIVIAFLSAFTLLFAMFCMIGRATLDTGAGGATRYLALLIPGLIALSLQLERLPRRSLRITATSLLALILLVGHAVPTQAELQAQADARDLKEAWRYEFFRTGDAAAIYPHFPFDIYTAPTTDFEMVNRKARFLREHHLNMYRPE